MSSMLFWLILVSLFLLQKKEPDDGDATVPEEIANNLDNVTMETLRVCLLWFLTNIIVACQHSTVMQSAVLLYQFCLSLCVKMTELIMMQSTVS